MELDALEAVRRLTMERDALANELDAVKDDFRVSRQTLDSIRAATGLYNYRHHLAESLKAMKEDRDALAEQVKRLEADKKSLDNLVLCVKSQRDDAEAHVKRLQEQMEDMAPAMRDRDRLADRAHELAGQVKRLEDSVTWHREELERTRAEWEQQENTRRAPERRERPETGTEPTKDQNGAPRGCGVASRACETCRHWTDNGNDGPAPTGYCHAHPPMANHEAPGALAIYPTTVPGDCCGEWQLDPAFVV